MMFTATKPIEPKKYRYPPERQSKPNGLIFGVVVDKKGDASGTTMKQNEIFCYSPSIRKNFGYFVMPKTYWKSMKKGDWFVCVPEYVDHKDPAEFEEKHLTQIKLIPHKRRFDSQLPQTLVHLENVQICSEFIKSPNFIDNNYLAATRGSANIHKLVLWNTGTAFFSEKKFPIDCIQENRVYRGVFEFRGPDNGGVNFRPHVKDKYTMPLERDTYWELVEIMELRMAVESKTGECVKDLPIEKSPYWVKYLKDLKEWAIEYGETIEVKFLNNPPKTTPKRDVNSNFCSPRNVSLKLPPKAIENNRTLNFQQSRIINQTTTKINGLHSRFESLRFSNSNYEPVFTPRNTQPIVAEGRRMEQLNYNRNVEYMYSDNTYDTANLSFAPRQEMCSTPRTSPKQQRRRF
ncbi:unnamed protein product [Caenorhabditis angaria]|uniref:Uncharacterized protein n=1 Tax=Caenorhabditis angaria TaxID=860376 RepID=A0A9P1IQ88_9PELO|nr:unnamed protein product [Caenorhabditis angaria]